VDDALLVRGVEGFGNLLPDAQRLIERKRDGGRIEPGEWRALTSAYAAGHVPDYQMAAFLLAAYIRGLDRAEMNALTDAMLATGARLSLDHLGVG
jgi:pyrimidine-nucleoside phosphorylase